MRSPKKWFLASLVLVVGVGVAAAAWRGDARRRYLVVAEEAFAGAAAEEAFMAAPVFAPAPPRPDGEVPSDLDRALESLRRAQWHARKRAVHEAADLLDRDLAVALADEDWRRAAWDRLARAARDGQEAPQPALEAELLRALLAELARRDAEALPRRGLEAPRPHRSREVSR